jgi:hypothetical protein
MSGVWKFKSLGGSFGVLKNKRKLLQCICKPSTIALLVIFSVYAVINAIPPILLFIWLRKLVQWHDNDLAQRSANDYTYLAIHHHISDPTIRFFMVVATRIIMDAWSSEEKDLQKDYKPNDIKQNSPQWLVHTRKRQLPYRISFRGGLS